VNTATYSRNKPAGLAHRAQLSRMIVQRLQPGHRIPSANWLSRFLGLSSSEAARHMRRALVEAGITTETRGRGCGRRIYVVALGGRP